MNPREIARRIDHTNLRPDAGDREMEALAGECVRHGFWSACANTRHVPLLARLLAGTAVRITSVAGFPLGAALPSVKAAEAERAVAAGAHEVDMVLSVGDLVAGEDRRVEEEIRLVREAIPGATLKVILECGLLTDARKRRAAEIVVAAGADFVKTSTGFGHGGATVEDVRLLRKVVGPAFGVKASAGIRTFEEARALVAAGADRLGTSAGVAIVSGAGARSGRAEPDRPGRGGEGDGEEEQESAAAAAPPPPPAGEPEDEAGGVLPSAVAVLGMAHAQIRFMTTSDTSSEKASTPSSSR